MVGWLRLHLILRQVVLSKALLSPLSPPIVPTLDHCLPKTTALNPSHKATSHIHPRICKSCRKLASILKLARTFYNIFKILSFILRTEILYGKSCFKTHINLLNTNKVIYKLDTFNFHSVICYHFYLL